MEQQEFDDFMSDGDKHIDGDIEWSEDEDHSPSVEFRVSVISAAGYPISVKGSFNPIVSNLTYAIIDKRFGRIYALDFGPRHRNPDGEVIGEKHKHRWSSSFRDKRAYEPTDITAKPNDPLKVWEEFCTEANIVHNGIMNKVPPWQLDMLLL